MVGRVQRPTSINEEKKHLLGQSTYAPHRLSFLDLICYFLWGPSKTARTEAFGLWSCSSDLRTYPPRFALRIAKYYDRFCASCEPFPPEADRAQVSAKRIFQHMSWEDDPWDDAGLRSLFIYLRGATGLDLGDWRPFFPTML